MRCALPKAQSGVARLTAKPSLGVIASQAYLDNRVGDVLEQAAGRPLISMTRKNCAQLFFIYPGLANRVVPYLKFIEQSGLGDRNLALVRDPYHENYARGVSDGIPTLTALVEWHKRHLSERPYVKETYHLGNSSGAYGAMLFGHLLRSSKVWAFGPRTARLSTANEAKAFLKDLLAQSNGFTQYFIHYATSNRRDCAFAEYYANSPGVVLCPYEGTSGGVWDHMIMLTLMENGTMSRLMPPYLPVSPAELPASDHQVVAKA
jgi:hypothetical protein